MADTVLAVSTRLRRKAGDEAMAVGVNFPRTIFADLLPQRGCEVAMQRASDSAVTTLHERFWRQTNRRHQGSNSAGCRRQIFGIKPPLSGVKQRVGETQ